MFYEGHFIQTFLIVLLLTVIPVLQGPAGDDVLHQDGVALHEDQLGHEVDGGPLQLPDLHVHRAQLGQYEQCLRSPLDTTFVTWVSNGYSWS